MWKRQAAAVALSTLLAQSVACANNMQYAPAATNQPARLTGEIPITKLGPLLLPHGLAKFRDRELVILAVPRWLFDRNPVLNGVLINAEQSGAVIHGLLYFYEGEWLPDLGRPKHQDLIATADGAEIRGEVLRREGASLVVKAQDDSTRNITISEIKSIDSPRAFTFVIALPATAARNAGATVEFDTDRLDLSPTRTAHSLIAHKNGALPHSGLSGTEPGISKRALSTFVALDLINEIAPAVVAPLVLNKNTQQAGLSRLRKAVINNTLNSSGGPTPPLPSAINPVTP